MNKLARRYNYILQVILILLPLLWLFKKDVNNEMPLIISIIIFIFILFTIFMSIYTNKVKKVHSGYISIVVYAVIIMVLFFIKNRGVELNYLVSMLSMIILPLCLVFIDEVRISDRVLGTILIIIGISSLFNIGNIIFIKNMSLILVPLTFLLLYYEDNFFIKLLYIFSNYFLLSLLTDKLYILILLTFLELTIAVNENKKISKEKEMLFLLIYVIGIIFIAINYTSPLIPYTFIMSAVANKGFIKEKYNLLFTSNDLSIGGIETSLVNLINGTSKEKYNVTLILEKKKGSLLKAVRKDIYVRQFKVYNCKIKILNKIINLSKRIIFSIFNYHTYDFSCCYATYSYCGNKLAKISSTNSSIYVHSNYKYVYKNIKDTIEFFDTRKMNEFRKIIFVSNEARDSYLELYPSHKSKSLVINNFIDINAVLSKRKESLGMNKPKNKKLLVFVGRLDEKSKKITRIIDIGKEINDIAIWIIGDGPDRKKYEDLINKNNLNKKITMFGSISAPYNYMDKADYIILTSDYEGFPVVYLEALALQKEIITTFPTSDEKINMYERAHIISKDNYIDEIKKIIKQDEKKNSEINLKNIQYERRKKLEKIFEGVI